MTTIAIVGAGPGLGASVARTFSAQGFDVALISRHQAHVDDLAAELAGEGVTARGYAADVRDPQSLTTVLDRVSTDLGPVEVLQYSPLPQKEFLRPVLETTERDLVGAVEFSVYGPVAAAHQVLAGMRALGRGSILLVNGGSAARPNASVAGTSIAFAGLSAYGQMLHEVLAPEGIHVGQIIIPGAIDPQDPASSPDAIARKLWSMHHDRGDFRVYAQPMDD